LALTLLLLGWLMMELPTLRMLAQQNPSDSRPAPGQKSKEQKYCPVMISEEVDPETSPQVMYEGVTIYLCCDQCVNKFRRDPAAYLDPVIVPALQGKKLPPRGLEQVYCPVLRDRKVSSKDPFIIYQGVKVYFYNDLARQRFEKDPQRYADPAILPQLKKTPPPS
jgi:YHS domain-containing protein